MWLPTWDSCSPFPCAFATGEAWSLVEPSPVFRRRMEARVTHVQSWLCDRTHFRWTLGACALSCLFCLIKKTEQKIGIKFHSRLDYPKPCKRKISVYGLTAGLQQKWLSLFLALTQKTEHRDLMEKHPQICLKLRRRCWTFDADLT